MTLSKSSGGIKQNVTITKKTGLLMCQNFRKCTKNNLHSPIRDSVKTNTNKTRKSKYSKMKNKTEQYTNRGNVVICAKFQFLNRLMHKLWLW